MATSQKLTDQFLTCAVCFEVFTDPVTLDCQHKFCRICVICFTKTKPDAITAKSVPCPTCRRLTKVTNPGRPVEEWANLMKPSLVIQGLTESFGPATKGTDKCSLCHEGGETTPAIAWCSACDVSLCQRCLTAHGRIPSSRHHHVSDLTPEMKVNRKRKVPCTEHKDEFIKFYCKGCKKTVCQTCCILYHRKCDKVILLESMVPEMKSAIRKRKDKVSSNLLVKSTLLTETKETVRSTEQSKTSMKLQVGSTCQRVIGEVKKKEEILMDEIEEVTEKHVGELKAKLKATEMVIQNYKQDISMMDHFLESESENDLHDFWQTFNLTPLEPLVDKDADLNDSKIPYRISLTQDIGKLNKSLEDMHLGVIDVKYEVELDLGLTPALIDTIDVHLPDDPDGSCPVDVSVLDVNGVDTIVVTDYNNKSVKSFFRRNNQQYHIRHHVDDTPWNVTQIKPNQVAVTVLNAKQIVIFEVNPELNLLSTIGTEKQYWGIITLTSTTFAASSTSPPGIDVLDMTGNILKSINPVINNNQILKAPKYLGVTKKGDILVSDRKSKSVLCLTFQGDVVFNYSPTGDNVLTAPKGITVINTGDIMVADWDLSSVVHLTDSGQFVRNILTPDHGLCHPYKLSIDKHGRMYSVLNEGTVKIFEMMK